MTVRIPDYVAGTWTIDAAHSHVSFSVRHLMMSKIKGSFRSVAGTVVMAENPLDSTVLAEIDLNSLDTGNAQRDAQVRAADFFDTATHPSMTYESSSIAVDRRNFVIHGYLTLKGRRRHVPLALTVNGFRPGPAGEARARFTATGAISRKDFDLDVQLPMDGGGVVIGDSISINLLIQTVLSPTQ